MELTLVDKIEPIVSYCVPCSTNREEGTGTPSISQILTVPSYFGIIFRVNRKDQILHFNRKIYFKRNEYILKSLKLNVAGIYEKNTQA